MGKILGTGTANNREAMTLQGREQQEAIPRRHQWGRSGEQVAQRSQVKSPRDVLELNEDPEKPTWRKITPTGKHKENEYE